MSNEATESSNNNSLNDSVIKNIISIETPVGLESSISNNNHDEMIKNLSSSLPTPPTLLVMESQLQPKVTLDATPISAIDSTVVSSSIENIQTIVVPEEIQGGDLDNVVGAGIAIDGEVSADLEGIFDTAPILSNGNGVHNNDSPVVETLLSPVTPSEALAIAQAIPNELLPPLSSSPSIVIETMTPTIASPVVVEPPAPIGAPEILPPPPTLPLPIFQAPPLLPPTLERSDSISSVVVEPPTPSVSGLPPTPSIVSSTPIPISMLQTPVASTSASPTPIPDVSTSYSTPAPVASTSTFVQNLTPLPQAHAQDEDTVMSEVSDSPVNKRSAEESVEQEGQGEAKRARVESEVLLTPSISEPIIAPPLPSPSLATYIVPTPAYAPIPSPSPAPVPEVLAASSLPPATIPTSAFFAEPTPPIASTSAPLPIAAAPIAYPQIPVAEATSLPQQYQQQPLQPQQEFVQAAVAPVAAAPYESLAPVPVAATSSQAPVAAVALAPVPVPVVAARVGPEGPVAVLSKEQHKWALSSVRTLKKNRQAPPFLKPVDPVALLIPDYFRVVTKPMDLGTVETKLMVTGKAMAHSAKNHKTYGLDYSLGTGLWEGSTGFGEVYRTLQEFKEDVERVWENCFKYNGPKDKNPVSAMAGALQEVCEKMFLNAPYAPEIVYNPPPPVVIQAPVESQAPYVAPVQVKSEVRRQSVSSSHRASFDSSVVRPKRETQVPARVADLEEGGSMKAPRQGKISGKAAHEQLKFCKEVMKELFKKNHAAYAFVFYEPVDYMNLNIPQYPSIVKKPIDLGTIRSKLEAGQYPVPPFPAFEADMRLLFKNCYLFNPPGTPVHEWGKLVEGVFEAKWEERPQAPEYEEESDDEQLHDLERQLATLQHSIATIKAAKRTQKEERKAAEKLSRPPKVPKAARQQSHSGPSDPHKHRSSTSGPSKRGRGGGSGVGNSSGPGRKRKNHKKDEWDSDQDDDTNSHNAPSSSKVQEVTFDMKRELAVKIVAFEGEALDKAIDIIRRGRPELLGDANKEIELDIDQLDQSTLLALYRYVCPAPKKPIKRRVSSAPAPKRKSMDEMKESERIRDLEARLREFEGNANSGGGDRRGSNAVGNGGGDQASSSSSSEGESESESDED